MQTALGIFLRVEFLITSSPTPSFMSPVENGRWALQERIQPVSLLSHPVGRGNVAVAGHDRRPRTVKAHEFTIALNKPQNPLFAQLGTPTLTSGMSF